MKKKKRRSKSRKARELIEESNIVDLEMQRESKRRQLRARADASRKKRGVKSIKEQMMEEVSMGDMAAELYSYGNDYGIAGRGVVRKSGGRSGKSKKKKSAAIRNRIILLAVIAIMVAVGFSIGNIVSLKMQENSAKAEIEELKQKKAELTEQVAELGSDEYVEQQARNWLKMAKRGEIVYVLQDDQTEQDEEEGLMNVPGGAADE